jgi:hypothetical protein
MTSSESLLDLSAPTVTVEEAAQYLGISRAMAYTEADRYRRTGGTVGIPNLKLGGRVLVITALLIELLKTGTDPVEECPDLSQHQVA